MRPILFLYSIAIVLIGGTFSHRLAYAQIRIGNGGDVVYCAPSEKFSGYYSYDYLATYNLANENSDLFQAATLQESLVRLKKVIARILPDRESSFAQFVQHLNNHTNRGASQIWLARPGDLIDVPNLPHLRQLPSNCQEVHQAVIRYELGSQIVYEFNQKVFDHLHKRPLQLSFLILHEFLWEIYPVPAEDAISSQSRFELTRFMHSHAALDWSKKMVWSYVTSLGVVPIPEVFQNYLSWSEKYNPPQSAQYLCTINDWMDYEDQFILAFENLSYLGSSGGHFYDDVFIKDAESGAVTGKLLVRPAYTEGLYVFEGGFNFMLHSSNPLDGSFENNMSEKMGISVNRGGGQCILLY